MRLKLFVVGSLAISLVAIGSAQTRGTAPSAQPTGAMKFAGTMECPAAAPAGMAEVGDTPGHAFVLIKTKCTWTKGDMAGVKLSSEEDAGVSEMTSATASKDMGYGVSTLANGDKSFVKFQGSGTYKAGNPPAPTAASGTFSFTGGTGKMKGLKGNGTYKGVFKADGSVTWTIDGTYSIPGAK
jgi:hypothetical protein